MSLNSSAAQARSRMRLIQLSCTNRAALETGVCGNRASKLWNAPGQTCNSADTSAAHSLDAYSTTGSRNTSFEPTSMNAGGSPCRSSVRDLSLELLHPEIEEVVDLVHRSQVAGLAGLRAVLELLEQGLPGNSLGLSVGGDRADLTVVIAVAGL